MFAGVLQRLVFRAQGINTFLRFSANRLQLELEHVRNATIFPHW